MIMKNHITLSPGINIMSMYVLIEKRHNYMNVIGEYDTLDDAKLAAETNAGYELEDQGIKHITQKRIREEVRRYYSISVADE